MIVSRTDSPDLVGNPDNFVPPLRVVRVIEFNFKAIKELSESVDQAVAGPQPVVPVVISTWGGYADVVMAMAEILKSSPKPIMTVAEGVAASCGAVLLSCGSEGMRYAAPHSRILVHQLSGATWGTNAEIQVTAKEIDRMNRNCMRFMSENCGKPANYWLDLIAQRKEQNVWLTPQQAKRHNLVNKIGVPRLTARAELSFAIEND